MRWTRRTRDTKCHVRSPDWSQVEKLAGLRVDTTACVHVPKRHWLLVSWWLRIQTPCGQGRLKLDLHYRSRQGSSHQRTVCSVWYDDHPEPQLLHADDFSVHLVFTPNRGDRTPVFRLLFSFHQEQALPSQLSDGLWNCSLPHWPLLRKHVRCNLHVECAGGEDEANCAYETEACGPGRISAAGGCYVYVASKARASWTDANAACMKKGGYLASLNTPDEWRAVAEVLQALSAYCLYAGLTFKHPQYPERYLNVPTWADGTVAYYHARASLTFESSCSSFDLSYYRNQITFKGESCIWPYKPNNFLCELKNESSPGLAVRLPNGTSSSYPPFVSLVECPSGHVNHAALACDVHSACWGRGYGSAFICDGPIASLSPSFACTNKLEFVPYSLVCDFRQDCGDGSDEDFCVFPPCEDDTFHCGHKECIDYKHLCDGIEDCSMGVDETRCDKTGLDINTDVGQPPYIVQKTSTGYLTIASRSHSHCSGSRFSCNTIDMCLPLFLRCNGVNDCPGREDEQDCDKCPGLYRCRKSHVCLRVDSLCDQHRECPLQDDELFCRVSCPQSCTCHALSARCRQRFSARQISDLRFLEARGSAMKLTDLANKTMLVHLDVGACGLRSLSHAYMPNVRFLDVSDNFLTEITVRVLIQFPNLLELFLDGNPLESNFLDDAGIANLSSKVVHLKLSRVLRKDLDIDTLTVFPSLEMLNMSGSRVEHVHGQSLKHLTELTTLDVRQCPLISFPPDILRTRRKLTAVFSDNFKLCCPAMLPEGFNLAHCHAPRDEISSCDALLRSDAYRVLLSLFSALALVGNLGSFTYRVVTQKSRSDLGFGVFVTHLCVSDLLMGIYLAIIGVADRVYLGSYLWNDVTWKNSRVCSMAGFLCLLSSEVSAFLISFITLDRILVLRFPFRQLRFHPRSAHVASAFVWIGSVMLAAIPLLPVTSNWHFYSQNGICVPLPVTQRQFPGQFYSFAVFIVLNFLLFVLIALGQLSIYHTVKTNTLAFAETKTSSSKDLTIARRLFTVAMSDFLCWFPIGVLGLLVSSGSSIPGEVNVAMAILALPLNAALNPFLYTLNILMERRRRHREKRLLKAIAAGGKENRANPSDA